MKILFSHQNFPAQFGEFALYLARAGWEVTFATAAEQARPLPGVSILQMKPPRDPAKDAHRLAYPMERMALNGQGFARAALAASRQGYVPDIVVAHAGWGSGTFAKAVWPEVKYAPYAEWYYRYPYIDAVDDPDPKHAEDARAHALARNAPMLLDLVEADFVHCPSRFQAEQFPTHIRERMTVMPDGVDLGAHAPSENPELPDNAKGVPPDAEIVTYATRGMEPHRGFPQFMQALEILQKKRPKLHAIIGGEDRVAYGRQLPDGMTWKTRMLAELDLDPERLHWPGLLPRSQYTRLLQSSHVHVYLTVPFVLSWSFLEAMSTGCALVASDVAPVREVADDQTEALFCDLNSPEDIANRIDRLLSDRDRANALGAAARGRVLRDFDRRWVFPARARLLSDVVRR
ncbi:MAG: glycosyltransferase [Pseudomonadota bacterium]